MKKLLLLALCFSSFSLSGFAITTEQQLFEQKYQLEQQKEQIKGLEDGLKKYTDDKVEDSNKRVEIINGSVDRFTGVVTILGIGLPIILFLIGWFSAKNTAKKETEEFLNEWVETKADGDFKELAKKKLNEKLYEFEKIFNDKLDKIEKIQYVKNLYDEAWKLGIEGKNEEAIKAYDELIAEYEKPHTDSIQEIVAKAMGNKAMALGQLCRSEEEINTYNKLIAEYAKSHAESIKVQVAKAMYNKAITLGQLRGKQEEINIYNELIAEYAKSHAESIQAQVAKAMINKYEWLIIQNKSLSKEENEWIESEKLKLKDKASFGLLKIINDAKYAPQDQEVEAWIDDYKDIKYKGWTFEELRKWITNSSHNEEVKNRISGYIDIFEKHLHRD